MTGETPERRPKRPAKLRVAHSRAKENVDRWGQQSPAALMLALIEETGELAEEIGPEDCPEYEDESVGDSWYAIRRQISTASMTQRMLEFYFEDEDGNPLPEEERPNLVTEADEMNVEAVREELYDIMALCFQLDWALYQGVREADDE